MTYKKFLALLFLCASSMAMVACNGGSAECPDTGPGSQLTCTGGGLGSSSGGGSSGGSSGGSTPTVSNATLEGLAITVGSNPATAGNPVKQGTSGSATVTLKDAQGNPIPNKVVTFSTTAGNLVPASGSIQTDSNGKATITITAGSGGQTAATLTAVYSPATGSAVTASAVFTTKGDAPPSNNSADYTLSGMAITVNGLPVSSTNPITASDAGTATVVLKDPTGALLANQVVTFSSTAGGLDPTTGSVLTNSSGVASIVLTAGTVKTAGLLTATYNAANGGVVKASLGFQTAGDATTSGASPAFSNMGIVAGTPPAPVSASNPIDDANPGTATVTLEDSQGNPIPNALVVFSTTAGQMNPSTGQVLTDASGVATTQLLAGSGGQTAGTLTAAYAVSSDATIRASANFSTKGDSPVSGNTAYDISITLTPDNIISKGDDGLATVTLQDSQGAPLANRVIDFSTSAGILDPSSAKVLTNASGEASITLKDAGVETAGVLQASFTDAQGTKVSTQTGFSMAGDGSTSVAGPVLSMPVLTNGTPPQTIGTSLNPITPAKPASVSVTLNQADGITHIEGAVVSFSLSSSVGQLAQATALTDASGEAKVTLNAGNTQGAGTLTATYTDPNNGGIGASSQTSFAVQLDNGSGPHLSTPELKDAASAVVGTTVNPITVNNAAQVRVELTDGTNTVANKVITFTLVGATGVGALDPSTGTALTDNNGIAIINLNSGPNAGASTLVASYDNGAATSQIDFTTRGAGQTTTQTLALGTLEPPVPPATTATFSNSIVPPTSPSVGSSYAITVDVVDITDAADPKLFDDAPVVVTFTSACAQAGNATFSPVTATSIGGQVVTTYKSDNNNCSSDNIQASATVNSDILTASTGSFAITKSPPNAINFLGAVPAIIGIKGASAAGVQETSTLTFQVMDGQGQNVGQGFAVDFTVKNPVGGFGIKGATGTVTSKSASTDADGKVSITVASGSVPTVGTIEARLQDDPDGTTTPSFDESTIYGTGTVSVQQGVATQDRFAIAVETLNPAAGNHLGVTDRVTIRAADTYGNWVPDGTIIHFATELGDIDPSCTTANGTCSVIWTSHGVESTKFDKSRSTRSCFTGDFQRNGLPVRPSLLNCGAHDLYGVNVITAWVKGEESFDDLDGNNRFDSGEHYIDLPEYFQDYNLTGLYETPSTNIYVGEDFGDINTNGQHDGVNGTFDGLSCSVGTTGCQRKLVDARDSATMVLSTDNISFLVSDVLPSLAVSDPTLGWGTAGMSIGPVTTHVDGGSGGVLHAVVADKNGNAPPIGTTITVTVDKANGSDTKILGPSTCTINNTLEPTRCDFSYVADVIGDTFTLSADPQGGAVVSWVVAVVNGGGDEDGDTVNNTDDNCLTESNPSQIDTDGDGVGDRCDANPGDPSVI